MIYKNCSRCKESLPADRFVKNACRSDGLSAYCRPCNREYNREVSKRPHIREQRRAGRNTEGGKKILERYRGRYPYKRKAALQVTDAIRRGVLVNPGQCEACKSDERTEAHHDDYSYPLDVRWLCRLCHRDWHRRNGPGAAPDLTRRKP